MCPGAKDLAQIGAENCSPQAQRALEGSAGLDCLFGE